MSDDDSTLFVTAAGSDKLVTVDAATGEVLGRADVGAVPRGIALQTNGKQQLAWVLNAVGNTVSLVDVSDTAKPAVKETITLEDPTHPAVKRGRIAFNTASASTTRTFSCASCHPDGHTDQLLWVLKTPIVTGGDQIMPRSTMPIRGLRDTEPYHWDGIPGDPYGGNNSANVHGSDPPNSKRDDPTTSTRHLIDGGLAATMFLEGDATKNDEDKAGELTAAQRNDMAKFLLSVPYPPAQRRAYDNVLSEDAVEGFKLFHIDGDDDPTKRRPNVCGNCHRMPFLVSTNTPGTGMDAPTWRGAYDRFLILPQGRLNIIDFPFYARVAEQGIPERNVWQFSWAGRRRFDPVWDMVLEGSTGYSGSFARQVTLNKQTADEELTADLLNALEVSAREGAVVLTVDGVLFGGAQTPVSLRFDPAENGGRYKSGSDIFSRETLVALASSRKFVGTFTGRHGIKADIEHPQPALWTLGPIERQRGRQQFPIVHPDNRRMAVSGRHIDDGARVIVDGRLVSGEVAVRDKERVDISLAKLPDAGMHLLQVQNPDGQMSNDFIFHVVENESAVAELRRSLNQAHVDFAEQVAQAIYRNDLDALKRVVGRNQRRANDRVPSGSTPLAEAAVRGRLEMVKLLVERGAKVSGTNRDGNTPLHVAAFMCHQKVVQFLLDKGASTNTKNGRGETPIDVVSGDWSKGLGDFYTGVGRAVGIEVDLKQIERQRPELAKLLRNHAK